MTETFRCQIDRTLIREASRVAKEIGTSPGEVVRQVFAQMVKRRKVPFPIEADSPEDEVLGPAQRRAQMLDEMYEGQPAARRSLVR